MLKLPIIRHIRYFWLSWRVHRQATQYGEWGIGLGVPNQSDLNHLKRIWSGKA